MNPLVCLGAARDGAPVVHVPDKGAQAPHEPPCHHLLSLDEVEEDQVGTYILYCQAVATHGQDNRKRQENRSLTKLIFSCRSLKSMVRLRVLHFV